ncbi:(2Fe-2S)-binding protein [Cohnella sp.]|uniref:(2Fe-2S)-binding protein n=1 Tax=Cohnella sp. TaxID=1883426 RepID=UPI00356A15E0
MDLRIAEEHFHISTKGSEAPLYSIAATDILQHEKMLELLQRGSVLVKGIGLELAVSFLGLAYFGLAATKQFVMSRYNRVLDLSLENLTIQLQSSGDYAQAVFKLKELKWTELPANDRETALLAEWKHYFEETMNPLIEATAGSAGFKPAMIWNQYGARMSYTMDYLRSHAAEGSARQLLEEDFLLLSSLPAETFNLRRKNPFDHTPCYIDSPYQPGNQIMIRSSCCMYYRRENGVKCYNCPLLKDEERAEMKLKIEADRQGQSA